MLKKCFRGGGCGRGWGRRIGFFWFFSGGVVHAFSALKKLLLNKQLASRRPCPHPRFYGQIETNHTATTYKRICIDCGVVLAQPIRLDSADLFAETRERNRVS